MKHSKKEFKFFTTLSNIKELDKFEITKIKGGTSDSNEVDVNKPEESIVEDDLENL